MHFRCTLNVFRCAFDALSSLFACCLDDASIRVSARESDARSKDERTSSLGSPARARRQSAVTRNKRAISRDRAFIVHLSERTMSRNEQVYPNCMDVQKQIKPRS